jgi:branched-chain amino acid transport system permease protein
MPSALLQIFFDSLLLSGLYCIGALGFALIWSVLNVLNLAYAAFIMLGGYVSWFLWRAGVDPLLTLPLAAAAVGCVGWLLQRWVIGCVVGGPASLGIALTYGLNLIIVGAGLYFFTAEYRSIVPPDYLKGVLEIGGARLTYIRVLTMLIALLTVGGVWWFMDRTEIGSAIRATRLDMEAARLVGIEVGSIFGLTTAISAALGGLMGGLIVLIQSASPVMGDQYLLQILIVTVLGGLGSVIGPMVGAVILGFATALVGTVWGTSYSTLVGTMLVLVVLVVRPSGLFGRRFYET